MEEKGNLWGGFRGGVALLSVHLEKVPVEGSSRGEVFPARCHRPYTLLSLPEAERRRASLGEVWGFGEQGSGLAGLCFSLAAATGSSGFSQQRAQGCRTGRK